MVEQPVTKKLNRYQIAVMLLVAAVTYSGLCLLMPGERAQRAMEPALDRIASVQAQALPQTPQSQTARPAGWVPNPVIEAIPLQTQVVHSSRWSTKRAKMVPPRRIREGKPRAERAPMDLSPIAGELAEDYQRRLELGLVPEAIVLPKKEVYEISSLILVKPPHGNHAVKKD